MPTTSTDPRAAAAALLTMTAAMSVGAYAADAEDATVAGYLPPQSSEVMAQGDIALHSDVPVGEVDPKTMQSKKAQGLYFAGEVLDVDAYTGGYNLQIAFCTAQSFANHLE